MAKRSDKKNLYGESLDRAMEMNGMRPEVVAKACEKTINDVLQWMYKDRTKIKEDTMERLCRCLGVEEETLSSPRQKSTPEKSWADIHRETLNTGKHYGEISARSRLEQTKIVRKIQLQ